MECLDLIGNAIDTAKDVLSMCYGGKDLYIFLSSTSKVLEIAGRASSIGNASVCIEESFMLLIYFGDGDAFFSRPQR